MKKILLVLLAVFSPALLFGQGVMVPPQSAFKVVNGVTTPIANATITVCAANTGGYPCSPPLVSAIFKDAALTQPLSNPFTADSAGNYQFAIAPGNYTVTQTALGFTGYSYQITASPSSTTAGLADPGANGVVFRNGLNTTRPGVTTDIIALFNGTCDVTAFVRGDGSCAPYGTFTQLSILNGTVTNSSISNNALFVSRTDNSPPSFTSPYINPSYAPTVRYDLLTQSGGVTGSQGVSFFNMPSIFGKTYTQTTAPVTGSGSIQSVPVSDSSMFFVGHIAAIDIGISGSTEYVNVTSIPDGTHVNGIFTLNHSSGAWVESQLVGDKIASSISISDQAGNSNNIFGENINVTVNAGGNPHFATGNEIDITSNVPVAQYWGQSRPYVQGLSIPVFGTGGGSNGISIATGDAVGQFNNGITIEGAARNYGILFTTGGSNAFRVPTAIAIQAALNYGIVIGSHQTQGTNPGYGLFDPTTGILLTAQGSTGTHQSNTLRFESVTSGVFNTWDVYGLSGGSGMRFNFNGSWQGAAIEEDGGIASQAGIRLRASGTNNLLGGMSSSGSALFFTGDIFQVNGNSATNGTFRGTKNSSAFLRNNANTGDIVAWLMNSSDQVSLGDYPGVFIPGGIQTTQLALPGAPTVTPTLGTATTWTYVIVGKDSLGATTQAGPSGTTALGAATLDGTHFNTITWSSDYGAASYDIYRTVVGTSPNTTGKIGTVTMPAALSLVDNGLAGDGTTAPIVNTTGRIQTNHLKFQTTNGHVNGVGGSNDYMGTISLSAATSGSYTFARAWGVAPKCTVSPNFDTTTPGAFWATTSTTQVTVNSHAAATGSFTYNCSGQDTF